MKGQSQSTNGREFGQTPRESVANRPRGHSDFGDSHSTVQQEQEEYFVDASAAALVLAIGRKYLLKLSRLGIVPAHPIGIGSRKQWRYRISELAQWALAQNATRPDNVSGSPRASKGRK